jgi:thiol-disulfide isomerase/thioredoxin
MFNVSKQTMWFIIILTTLISIYYIFIYGDNCYVPNYRKNRQRNYSILLNHNINKSTSEETSVPNRKKINKKHSKSKRIHVSPNLQRNSHLKSIKLMAEKLKKRISKTKLDVGDQQIMQNPENKPKYIPTSTPKSTPKYTVKLFFANWCQHCNDFKPIWNNIKSKYSDKIIFDSMNCSETNPGLEYVQGLPTIALYDSNNNYLENYEYDGTSHGFESFIINLLN